MEICRTRLDRLVDVHDAFFLLGATQKAVNYRNVELLATLCDTLYFSLMDNIDRT